MNTQVKETKIEEMEFHLAILNETDEVKQQQMLVDFVTNDIPHINPFLYATDSYKVSHKRFETNGVKEIYSNFTPRFSKYLQVLLGDAFDGKYVVFGMQWMLLRLHVMAQKGFFDRPKEEVILKMKKVHGAYIGNEDFEHFEALHDLGYLPIEVKTLDEGTTPDVGIPFFTIRNTLKEFEWLPNFLETVISTDTWKQLTVATIARAFRLISNEFAEQTIGGVDGALFTDWQNHDFSCRGQSGLESSAINGVGFLLSSCGTDNIMSLWASEKFYLTTNDDCLLAGSVSAGEHSVTTSGILTEQERIEASYLVENGEVETLQDAVKMMIEDKCRETNTSLLTAETEYAKQVMLDKFPTGIVAYVADSFDYYSFISKILPSLKKEVMSRDGKFVVRGDSGNPVDVICGFKDADIKDLIARSFVKEAQIGQIFSVDESEYIVNSLPDISSDTYLPFFLLENGGFIELWDPERKKLEAETKVTLLKNKLQAVIQLQNQSNDDSVDYEKMIKDIQEEIKDSEYVEPKRYVAQAEAKGTIEVLWEIFGGSLTEKGYKALDSHIGMIYGDGITVQRSIEILTRLKNKGFASSNIVFGVGSYSLNMISRDHLGMAIKATNTIVDIHDVDVDKAIYKDPKTDTTKKSARGLIRVYKNEDDKIVFDDNQTREQEEDSLLTVAYTDGQFKKLTNIAEIRGRMWS